MPGEMTHPPNTGRTALFGALFTAFPSFPAFLGFHCAFLCAFVAATAVSVSAEGVKLDPCAVLQPNDVQSLLGRTVLRTKRSESECRWDFNDEGESLRLIVHHGNTMLDFRVEHPGGRTITSRSAEDLYSTPYLSAAAGYRKGWTLEINFAAVFEQPTEGTVLALLEKALIRIK